MRLLFILLALVVGFFIFLFLVAGGMVLSLLGRVFGKSPGARPDPAMVQSLAMLSPGEKTLLADSLQRNDKAVILLSDQGSIDSLLAKGIVIQTEGDMGVMYYSVDDSAWNYLQRSRARF